MPIQHIPQITCDPGAENEFSVGDMWYIDTYNENDWNGTFGNLTKWYSDISGSQVEIVAPNIAGGIYVSYSFWKDIKNMGAPIYADNGTNIDLGNNYGIIFPIINQMDSLKIYESLKGNLFLEDFRKIVVISGGFIINV